MPVLTRDEWERGRALREAGASLQEVANELGVSKNAVHKVAKRDGWGDGSQVAGVIRRKAEAKLARRTVGDKAKLEEALDAAADATAKVIEQHREEWGGARERATAARETHRQAVDLEEKRIAFEDLKAAKIYSETLKIIQDGERKAWGLDAPIDLSNLSDAELKKLVNG